MHLCQLVGLVGVTGYADEQLVGPRPSPFLDLVQALRIGEQRRYRAATLNARQQQCPTICLDDI